MSASFDVVIVGGGVIGTSSAWRLTLAGLSVAIVDPAPGRGASSVAAGMLAPALELHHGEEALLALNLAGARRWPAFASEVETHSGVDLDYRVAGTLAVAFDTSDNAVLADLCDAQTALGLNIERLRAREVRQREPLLAPSVRGGIFAPDDQWVDPQRLMQALTIVNERAGVCTYSEPAVRIDVDGQRAVGVTTPKRSLTAGFVVLAAGSWSAQIAGLPPSAVPKVRPVKGQILTLQATNRGPAPAQTVRGVVRGKPVYLVPRDDGRVIVGATMEERGWDTTPTAGGVYELLRDATAILPGVNEMDFVRAVAGLRPGSPDNAPAVGATELEGLIVATGHHRNGILLTPITAGAIASLIVDGTVPEALAAFGPRRFEAAMQ